MLGDILEVTTKLLCRKRHANPNNMVATAAPGMGTNDLRKVTILISNSGEIGEALIETCEESLRSPFFIIVSSCALKAEWSSLAEHTHNLTEL